MIIDPAFACKQSFFFVCLLKTVCFVFFSQQAHKEMYSWSLIPALFYVLIYTKGFFFNIMLECFSEKCWSECLEQSNLTNKGVTAPLLSARQQMWVSRIRRKDHYKWMPRFTVDVSRKKSLFAQWPWEPSKSQNVQPFTGAGYVSICVKKYLSSTKKSINKWNTTEIL